MSAPATRASGRLGHEGNEDAEPEHHKGAGSRGRKEAQRLQNDVDRILQQPTNADRKRALHNSVRKWQNGAAFEQCWIGKLLIDIFPLPSAAFDGPAYLQPPSNYQQKSPLQHVLYQLLKSRNQGTELRQSHLCGSGILLRVMPTNKPVGATPERLKQLTAVDRGEAVAGCTVRLLLELKVQGAAGSTRTALHHALHVHFAATKKGQEDRGYMRLLMLGQVRLMAALLPNPHASVNSIFVNSTVRDKCKAPAAAAAGDGGADDKTANFCVYRRKFGFERDVSTRTFDNGRLTMGGTTLCSQLVQVEVDAEGDGADLDEDLLSVVICRGGAEHRASAHGVREKLARDAAAAAAQAEAQDALSQQSCSKDAKGSNLPRPSAAAPRLSPPAAASSSRPAPPPAPVAPPRRPEPLPLPGRFTPLTVTPSRKVPPKPSAKQEPSCDSDDERAAVSSVVSFHPVRLPPIPRAMLRSITPPAAIASQVSRVSGFARPAPPAATGAPIADAPRRPAKRARTDSPVSVTTDQPPNGQSAHAAAPSAPSAAAAAAFQPPILPPMEVAQSSAESVAPCAQSAAPMSLCSASGSTDESAARRPAEAHAPSPSAAAAVPAAQCADVAVKSEPVDRDAARPPLTVCAGAAAAAPAAAFPVAQPTAATGSRPPASRTVIDLMDSDDEADAPAAPPSDGAGVRVKLESAAPPLPQVKLEAIAVMRGALPLLSETQLWELLRTHGNDAAAAILAHWTHPSLSNPQQ